MQDNPLPKAGQDEGGSHASAGSGSGGGGGGRDISVTFHSLAGVGNRRIPRDWQWQHLRDDAVSWCQRSGVALVDSVRIDKNRYADQPWTYGYKDPGDYYVTWDGAPEPHVEPRDDDTLEQLGITQGSTIRLLKSPGRVLRDEAKYSKLRCKNNIFTALATLAGIGYAVGAIVLLVLGDTCSEDDGYLNCGSSGAKTGMLVGGSLMIVLPLVGYACVFLLGMRTFR